jgi:hypothetical protein
MLIAAALCWITSELGELIAGGRTSATLWLTAAFHQLMVFGIWGACLGRPTRRGPLAVLAATLVSVGYLVMVYPPLAVVSDPSLTIEGFMEAHPAFKAFGLAAVFGKVLFGISILRTRIDPAWTGLALVVGPLLFAGVMLASGPVTVAISANLLTAGALLAIGLRALQRIQPGR